MEEKIAVYCKSKEEWFSVEEAAFKRGFNWSGCKGHKYWWHPDKCLNVSYENLGHAKKDYYEKEGYTIITAAEYLGGKDVKELIEKGDQVEITGIQDGEDYRGLTLEVAAGSKHKEEGVTCRTPEGHTWYFNRENFKILTNKPTKPKTTKENNMELNSSIRTVFVEEDKAAFDLVEKMQKVFGGEIEENFTGAMILRDNKTKYTDEIKRLDDIEAKRLKEEAKKK